MSLEYWTWWLCSPGVACFLFLNVLVAAIAVTSSSRSGSGTWWGGRAATTTTAKRRLCRSASSMVLDRLRSFSTHPAVVELCYYNVSSPEAEERGVSGAVAPGDRQLAVPEEPTARAAAASSMMMSENAEDEITAAAGVAKPTTTRSGTDETRQEPMPSSPSPAAGAVHAAVVVTAETAAGVALVRGPPKEEPATTVTVAELLKRRHRHRAPVDALEGKAELNARAEQFIRQFRQELQLQRLDSMLRRRHAHTLSTSRS